MHIFVSPQLTSSFHCILHAMFPHQGFAVKCSRLLEKVLNVYVQKSKINTLLPFRSKYSFQHLCSQKPSSTYVLSEIKCSHVGEYEDYIALWNIAPRSLVKVHRLSKGALMMDAVRTSQTSVYFSETTWHKILVGFNLQSVFYSCEGPSFTPIQKKQNYCRFVCSIRYKLG
jgi:hypothetical protein